MGRVVAIAVGVTVLCGLGLAMLYFLVIVTSGPYADSQVLPRVYEPIKNIRLSGARLPLTWDVDDRFMIEFDNGFQIKAGSSLSEFSRDWKLRLFDPSVTMLKGTKRYYVSEGTGGSFIAVSVDESEVVVQVEASLTKKGMWLVDRKTNRRLQLYDLNNSDVVSFLESIPQ